MLSFHAKVVHFTFYIVMVFQNFDVDLKKNQKNPQKQKKSITYLWKLLLVKMSCSIFPSRFCGLSKSIQISLLVYLVMYFSVSQNLQETTQFYK